MRREGRGECVSERVCVGARGREQCESEEEGRGAEEVMKLMPVAERVRHTTTVSPSLS